MAFLLLLVVLAVPVIELYVTVQVASAIGAAPTVLLLVAVTLAGCWVVKRAGLGVWRRFQAQVQAGETPTAELIDGVLVLVAGALLVFPGFVTDVVAALLLLPPTRALVRHGLRGRVERAVGANVAYLASSVGGSGVRRRVYVGDAVIVTDARPADERAPGPWIDVPSLERGT